MTPASSVLARMLLDHVAASGIVSLDDLSVDPFGAIGHDESVEVVLVDPLRLPHDCSIAATYDPSRTPARISVSDDGSSGRRAFSLLHEYGHHLRNQVRQVLMELLGARGRSAALEERMCDEFASHVLIPDRIRKGAFASGVTADIVANVMTSSRASKQAVAVAAAEAMSAPGYVLLMDEGVASFAARSGDVFHVRRNAEQGSLLKQLAERCGRGVARVEHGWGVASAELNVDAARIGHTRVVVAVDGPVPWATFSAGREAWAEGTNGVCASCTREFATMAAPCRLCGEPNCTHCGACECPGRIPGGSMACASCFLILPQTAFTQSSTVCDDCS